MTIIVVTKKSWLIADNKTKNLLKKPVSGGIPAIENKAITKANAKNKFLKPKDAQLAINLIDRSVDIDA